MKSFRVLLSISMLLLAIASSTSGYAQSPQGTQDGTSIYLPMIVDGNQQAGSQTSFELIDQAVSNGSIDKETGLIYKVFSTFEDPRLPNQYQGSEAGKDGDLIMDEVASQAANLSEQAKQILTPFFVPPNYPGSWDTLAHLASTNTSPTSTTADLAYVTAAGGKLKIWYPPSVAGSQAKAEGLRDALNSKIWQTVTTTMGREPVYNRNGQMEVYLNSSYTKSNGAVVPFSDTTMGITISSDCYGTAVVIYLPVDRPLGNETTPGLVQYMSHELMHAVQHHYTMKDCMGYKWLKEATANWTEDLVYPKTNTEWIYDDAKNFMDRASERLDDTSLNHHYGAYLLPYFLSHYVDAPSVVRRIWENSETYTNSFLAIDQAVPAAARSTYWVNFLASLWNTAPYAQYYKSIDGLAASVPPQADTAVSISGANKEFIYTLSSDLKTGGALYYHFTFPDHNVHSLTILNGLNYKLSKVPIPSDGSLRYQSDPVETEDAKGVTLIMLMKVSGQEWQLVNMSLDETYTHCMDFQGQIEDMVVIESNADFEHPDRIMKAQGEGVTIFGSGVPCYQYSGTSSFTKVNDGVVRTANASSVTYQFTWPMPSPSPYQNLYYNQFPITLLSQVSAIVDYSISGTDSVGCVWDGEGHFIFGQNMGGSLMLNAGFLPGGKLYRSYEATGAPDINAMVTGTITCPNNPAEPFSEDAWEFLYISQWDDSTHTIPDGGGIQGSHREDHSADSYEISQWNLTASPK